MARLCEEAGAIGVAITPRQLALHGLGVDHIYHGVGGCHRSGGAFPLAHDRGHFAEQLAGLQCGKRQPFA